MRCVAPRSCSLNCTPMPAVRLPWAPFGRHPDHPARHGQLLVLAHQVEQHEHLVAEAVVAAGRHEQAAVLHERHVRQVQGALVLDGERQQPGLARLPCHGTHQATPLSPERGHQLDEQGLDDQLRRRGALEQPAAFAQPVHEPECGAHVHCGGRPLQLRAIRNLDARRILPSRLRNSAEQPATPASRVVRRVPRRSCPRPRA